MNSSTNAERAGAGRDIRAVVSWLALVLGPLAWVVLGVSVIWDGEQVAAGVHLTGLGLEARSCPGCLLCGLSRAVAHVSHGELGAALGANGLVLFAYPGLCLLALAPAWALAYLLRLRKS
ncbi:MAG: hypothetical protein CMK00_01235 [Planctomycetes bacterium]|jgi:hypothetical protein|nr:hypothetical protein [Planctomycetota bacterium]HJO27195.1 DUF2752 domain-containing protein [Planctomycetota bacterium]